MANPIAADLHPVKAERVLVLRAGAVGDVVLSFPVLRALKAQKISVSFAARTEARFLAGEAGLADEALDLSSRFFTPLFSGGEEGGELRAYLASFDLAISLLVDPSQAVARRLRSLGARSVLSLGSIREGEGVARQLFRVLEPLGIDRFPAGEPILAIGRPPPRLLPRRFAVLHAGSGSPQKTWPAANFVELGRMAIAAGYRVLLPQGEADAEPVRRVCRGLEDRCEVLELNLVDLAAVLAAGAFYVGNDSGVTHVAAQLGVHTVAVFGPTDPVMWRPEGPRVFSVCGSENGFPTPGEVRAAGGLGAYLD